MARRSARKGPKPFDVSFKQLAELRPADCIAYAGVPDVREVDVIDADLSTIIAEADKVIRINRGTHPWLIHFEFQASYDAELLRRVVAYNGLLYRRHGLPVWSVLILLRPAADSPDLTEELTIQLPNGRRCHLFAYQVVRVWRKPLASVLTGGLGMLPLAPLCDEAEPRLPEVIRRMEERIDREATAGDRATLWSATYFLMGLRYPPDLVARLLRGVHAMKESSTYQATLLEGAVQGAVQEAKKILLRMGHKRFGGPADEQTTATLEAITDINRLEQLSERLLEVSSWDELLPKPPAPRRGGGRKKTP